MDVWDRDGWLWTSSPIRRYGGNSGNRGKRGNRGNRGNRYEVDIPNRIQEVA